jgi:predicted dehydrogenase
MNDQHRKPIRTALIGCGKVRHTHAQALQSLPASEFVAVCDNDPGRATQFGDQYGARPFNPGRDRLAQRGILSDGCMARELGE